LVKGNALVEGLAMRTGMVEVELDEVSGAIVSLRRKGVPEEFVDPLAPVGLNDFRYVLGTNTVGAQANKPVKVEVIDAGPLVVTMRLTSDAPGCRGPVREVRMVEGLRYVEIRRRGVGGDGRGRRRG
jgi:hypothetical protein